MFQIELNLTKFEFENAKDEYKNKKNVSQQE